MPATVGASWRPPRSFLRSLALARCGRHSSYRWGCCWIVTLSWRSWACEPSEQDREILTLNVWEGLAPRDIAQVLGANADIVRIRLHRARSRVRTHSDTPTKQPRVELRRQATQHPSPRAARSPGHRASPSTKAEPCGQRFRLSALLLCVSSSPDQDGSIPSRRHCGSIGSPRLAPTGEMSGLARKRLR